MKPLVSVVILNYDGETLIERCLDSVLHTRYPSLEVVLVDNASRDQSFRIVLERYGKDPRLKTFLNQRNLGFSEGNNVGARLAEGKYISFLNVDTEVDPNWLDPIIELMEKDRTVGVVQSKIRSLDNQTIDCAGGFIDPYGFSMEKGSGEKDRGQYDSVFEVFFAKGAAMTVRRWLWDELGGFDPTFFMYSEEVDLCWRAWLRGYRVQYLPTSLVRHKGSASARKVDLSRRRFQATKNQICMLMKNYAWRSLIKYLTGLAFIQARRVIALTYRRRTEESVAILKAFAWNLRNLKHVWKERRRVQKQLRRMDDRHIQQRMVESVIKMPTYLLRPASPRK